VKFLSQFSIRRTSDTGMGWAIRKVHQFHQAAGRDPNSLIFGDGFMHHEHHGFEMPGQGNHYNHYIHLPLTSQSDKSQNNGDKEQQGYYKERTTYWTGEDHVKEEERDSDSDDEEEEIEAGGKANEEKKHKKQGTKEPKISNYKKHGIKRKASTAGDLAAEFKQHKTMHSYKSSGFTGGSDQDWEATLKQIEADQLI
jgi:hypothetical protein